MVCGRLWAATPSEAESKARELLNATFASSGNNWFCAQKESASWQLVELRNANYNFSRNTVEETDRLNGVTDRFTVYVMCDQYRERRGSWSEWKKGTPGSTQLIVAMSGGLLSYWSARGEKKNGVWSTQAGLGSHQLSSDTKIVRSLLANPDRPVSSSGSDVPSLALIKAAAEAGDAEAQYTYATKFGPGGADWKRWMNAAAAQGYGEAEDALAWTTNWAYFTNSDPKIIALHLKMHGGEMRQALLFASSAADKGFEHSRQLLGMAYGHGILVQRDRVEAYKWYRLVKDAERYPTNSSPNDELVKTMSLDQVREGEARAANYRPGHTAIEVRNALLIPKLKLNGLATMGANRVAIINGTKMSPGQSADLLVDGVSVRVKCISMDATSAVIAIAPDDAPVTLRTGGR